MSKRHRPGSLFIHFVAHCGLSLAVPSIRNQCPLEEGCLSHGLQSVSPEPSCRCLFSEKLVPQVHFQIVSPHDNLCQPMKTAKKRSITSSHGTSIRLLSVVIGRIQRALAQAYEDLEQTWHVFAQPFRTPSKDMCFVYANSYRENQPVSWTRQPRALKKPVTRFFRKNSSVRAFNGNDGLHKAMEHWLCTLWLTSPIWDFIDSLPGTNNRGIW